jgi:hypothetical protein
MIVSAVPPVISITVSAPLTVVVDTNPAPMVARSDDG